MSKLHELLAVEAPLKKSSEAAGSSTKYLFGNASNFTAFVRTYRPFVEDNVNYPEERLSMATDVRSSLDIFNKTTSKYFDAVLQKEASNQEATADIIIDGEVIASDLPATFLLGLETKLTNVRQVYNNIPTLPDNIEWAKDENEGDNIYVAVHNEDSIKAIKTIKSKVLYEATKEHPAQIDKWDELANVGIYSKKIWSGMMSTADKNTFLAKIDKLIIAVKKARQRANNTDVVKKQIGEIIFNYISE